MNMVENSYRRSVGGKSLDVLNNSTLNSSPVPAAAGQMSPININTGGGGRPGIFNPRRWFGRG